jgi:hypothetical protein
MRFVEVDKERFFDIMERCGAYIGNTEYGHTHRKELWCRNLSVWQGETVVGVYSYMQGSVATCSIAGYLDDCYK